MLKQLKKLLTHHDVNNPFKCNIILGEEEAFGISSQQLPVILNIYMHSDVIYLYLLGDCIIELNDLDKQDILYIYNSLNS